MKPKASLRLVPAQFDPEVERGRVLGGRYQTVRSTTSLNHNSRQSSAHSL